MLFDELIILILISLLGIYWYDAMQAREMAKLASMKACRDADLIFLDDTVAFRKIGLARNSYGQIRLLREYRFDFSNDGYARYHGRVVLLGKSLSTVDLGVYRI